MIPFDDQEPSVIHQAMRYSVFAGGKRIRPVLFLLAYELFAPLNQEAVKACTALELLHTYTLIHDDLPCMDDDDLRRGKPTLHKTFTESIALLAGDALLTLSFQVLAELKSKNSATVIKELATSAGSQGVIGGQVKDILSEGKDISLKELRYIHTNKTAKLIKASVKCGAILAQASETDLELVENYALNLGLAFQVADDILDVTGSSEKLGKNTGQDEKQNKATYPKIIGLSESKSELEGLITKAKNSLASFGKKASKLNEVADFIKEREK